VDGVLGQFVDYATSSAVSPQPFLALGAAICLVGAVAGRRYRTPTDLRSNLYAIGIADSGGGKDHARRCAKRALFWRSIPPMRMSSSGGGRRRPVRPLFWRARTAIIMK
jgi:hypothetical protein